MEWNYPSEKAQFKVKVNDATDGVFWFTSNGRPLTGEEARELVEMCREEARKTTQVGQPFIKYVGELEPLDED
jgi:hypothetical protein